MHSPTTEPLDIPDVNVLVALVHPNHLHHGMAHDWFRDVTRFATTPITEAGLVRLAMNESVVGARAASPTAAFASLESIRADPRATFVADDTTLAAAQIDLVGLVGYRQVTDMHLVNLAAARSAVLVTFDQALPKALTAGDRRHVRALG